MLDAGMSDQKLHDKWESLGQLSVCGGRAVRLTDSVKDLPRSGRPRVTSANQDAWQSWMQEEDIPDIDWHYKLKVIKLNY